MRVSSAVAHRSAFWPCVLVQPRHGIWERSVEDNAEVPGLDPSQVFDEAEQVRARRNEGATTVVLAHSFEFPEQRSAAPSEMGVQLAHRV